MHKPRTPTSYSERRSDDASTCEWMRDLWRARARAAAQQAAHPPHRAPGAASTATSAVPRGWRTRTGNGYYGGLQMDIGFQRAYGPELLRRKGTADRWTAVEQMWVAERAHRGGRGFTRGRTPLAPAA